MQERLEDRLERMAQGLFGRLIGPFFDLAARLLPGPTKECDLRALLGTQIGGVRMVPGGGALGKEGRPYCVYVFYQGVQIAEAYQERLQVRDSSPWLSSEGRKEAEGVLRILRSFYT